ncbi:EamA family transporter RarD [Pusillimonas sp. TS35]|uniref:EamA family transporter RarD n=1 Tax=Paracandidimonas lactea TaxID=2895524 RepID=UPI0013719A18|nr:EamA family transporter RarD [Paracandidimonas lactea]MYN13722.1 EamA family transporter RarD [Pusillimonas sp. TS35]
MKYGVALSVLSSCLFALLYFYATVLQPLNGEQVFAWRIVLGLPALALIIARKRAWHEVRDIVARLRSERALWLLLPLAALLIGVQLWLFVWAPLHQKALDVSMGYFLLPIVMVLVGRILYNERLSRLQQAAVYTALLGVFHELLSTGAFSWATAVVMFGYPPYFVLRRYLNMGSLGVLWFDMLFMAPVALALLSVSVDGMNAWEQLAAYPRLLILVPLLGLISSVALAAYLQASRVLPLGLFGLLGYVEPVLLFGVALFFLGEPVEPRALLTYVPIWISVMLVAGDVGRQWRRRART